MSDQDDKNPEEGAQIDKEEEELHAKLESAGVQDDSLKQIKTLSAQKAHFRKKHEEAVSALTEKEARIAQLNGELEALKAASAGKPKEVTPENQAKPEVEDRVKKIEFIVTNQNRLNPEDFKDLEAISKGYGIPLEKAIETDAWKAIASKREEERAKAKATLNVAPSSDKVNPQGSLTDEEKAAAKKFGISEEAYLASKKKHFG